MVRSKSYERHEKELTCSGLESSDDQALQERVGDLVEMSDASVQCPGESDTDEQVDGGGGPQPEPTGVKAHISRSLDPQEPCPRYVRLGDLVVDDRIMAERQLEASRAEKE